MLIFLKKKYNLSDNDKVLLVLPGSRSNELKKMLPLYAKVTKNLIKKYKNIKLIYMVPDEFVDSTMYYLNNIYDTLEISSSVLSVKYKNDIFSGSNLAVATSGTISLELAVSGIPSIICYKMSNLTYFIIKPLVKLKWISLPNIILNKEVFPEYIQFNCTVDKIYNAIDKLLSNDEYLVDQKNMIKNIRSKLSADDNFFEKIVPSIILNNVKK